MFAVFKTGGKQYKVANGDIVRIEKIAGAVGDAVEFNDVLILGGQTVIIGYPRVANALVHAKIVQQGKAAKVINFVKRRRKHSSQRRIGHRQQITSVRIENIISPTNMKLQQ